MSEHIKIHDAYTAALLFGLLPQGAVQLSNGEKKLLESALLLMNRPQQFQDLHALKAITGQVWKAGINKYFNPGRLKLNDPTSVFPEENGSTPSVPLNFRKGFEEEIEKVAMMLPPDSEQLRYTLYNTLYAWGTRVSFGDEDVSVFDQNRLLAATVQCLKQANGEAKFLLLKGAVSGIQSFIYFDVGGEQIGDAKKASKRLRGRSFLVAHLSQVLAEYLTEELDLEQANILFVGGGHFNLLLPDTDAVKNKLADLQKKLNVAMFQKMGMQLSLLLAWEPAGEKLFQSANIYFRKVSDQLEFNKQKRYANQLEEFFGIKSSTQDFREKENQREKEHEAIGQLIPYAEYLIEVRGSDSVLKQISDLADKNGFPVIKTFQFIGRHCYVIKKGKRTHIDRFINICGAAIYENDGSIKVTRLNSTDFMPAQHPAYPVMFGFEFIGNEAPTETTQKGEEIVSLFEDIAAIGPDGTKALSYPQLAAMRLDVDDLGTLFQYGLGRSASFEQIASLSREFQLFFGGYFNILAKQHHLYITYSGGDDAFVIGSWFNVVQFARTLNKEFRQFTCNNEYIGFSAGIFLCSPYYPVVRFADDAASLEKRAKEYKKPEVDKENEKSDAGKNAVCLFNQTMSWERFEEMMKFADKLGQVVPKENDNNTEGRSSANIRRSMLQHFLATIQASRKGEGDKKDFEFYRNLGRLHGLVSRHGYRKEHLEKGVKNKEPAAEIVNMLLKGAKSREEFEDFIVPLQYTLYLTRVINQ